MTPNSDHHLKTSMRPVTFVITFLLKPNDIGEFENLLGQVLDAMRAGGGFSALPQQGLQCRSTRLSHSSVAFELREV